MSIDNTILFAVGLLSLGWTFFVVCVSFPRFIRSMIRYKLWRLRDRVVDDVLNGDLPGSEMLDLFVAGIETVIDEAIRLGLVKWLMYPELPKREQEHIRQLIERGRAELTESQRKRFDEYQKEFHGLFCSLLLYASMGGWAAIVIFSAIVFPASAVQRLVRRGALNVYDTWQSVKSQVDEAVAMRSRDWITGNCIHRYPPLPLLVG